MLSVILGTGAAHADVPRVLSYQGLLTDTLGNPLPDGPYNIILRLYDVQSGGSPLWVEPRTVQLKRGIFSMLLGEVTPLTLPFDVYSGNVTLDGNGNATVELPAYFEEINKEFRYQLTPIGAPAPNLHVAEKIRNNSFRMAGGQAGLEVSWRVEAVRNDLWVRQHGTPVEMEKSGERRGKYLHPELYGMTRESGIITSSIPSIARNPAMSCLRF